MAFPDRNNSSTLHSMDVLIEDLGGSLWSVATDNNNKIQTVEIDPYTEIIRWGSIYIGKVTRIDKGQNAAYIDLGYDFEGILFLSDVLKDGKKAAKGKTIGQVLTPGQMIMVQIKTPFNPSGQDDQPSLDENKISKLTMDIAIQGRYLIYTPYTSENRISKRITDKKLRKNLKSMLSDIEDMEGAILRSSAAHCQTDMLMRESKILRAIWASLQEFQDESDPTLLMLGPNAMQRTLADLSGGRVKSISVATMEIFEETEEWCDLYAPDLMTKIEPRGAENTRTGMGLFEVHDLIGQLETLLKPYAVLPSGGVLIIEKTAAMTVIDVNSGADKNTVNVNLEAASEVARQIRLRNIGGIIMVDFINMKAKTHRDKILKELDKSFTDDPCTAQCHGVTELGVYEISRQRRTPTLEDKYLMFEMEDPELE